MYLTTEILDKLNASSDAKNGLKKTAPDEKVTLPDIMVRSFAEVKALTGDTLTWGEKNFLYQQAQKELKENKIAESRILSRANPQLTNAVRLGIRQSSMLHSYDDLFPQRTSSFVKPGSVASMFSPAGYLTELYREARGLHPDTSLYHLDTRRPDLASLSLSQANMDDELSTLSLSNELLLNNIQSQEGKDYDGVMEMLAAYRQTGSAPYSQPYEAVRQSIILRDPEFAAFRNNPAVAAKMDPTSLLGIQADISPELREILDEKITEDKVDDLVKKNFGDTDVTRFQSVAYLAHWYGLTYDEISLLLGLVTASNTITDGVQYYRNDHLISPVESDGKVNAVLITRTCGDNVGQMNYAELIPLGGNNFQFNYNFAVERDNSDFSIGTKGFSSDDLLAQKKFTPLKNTPYSATFSLSEQQLNQPIEIGLTRSDGGGAFSSYIFRQIEYSFSTFLLELNKLIRLYKATGIAPPNIRSIIENNNGDFEINSDVLGQLFRVNYYMQRYGIDVSAALVLAGATIGQVTHSHQASAFTRQFNAPMLNGTEFSADGTTIKLAPAEVTDTFRIGVMKRAFGVNDTELYTLWTLAQRSSTPGDFACTVENLSTLYRISLLADVHALSVTELAALLSVSPYASLAVESLSSKELAGLVSFIAQYTQWLKAMNWTVSDLYLMLTDRFSTTLSPDIENLITTLKNGLAGQAPSSAGETALITAAAPFIAAAVRLDSAETAAAILQWLSQLQPQELTVAGFLALADKDNRTDDETSALVSYCQVMGQLALIVQNTGLSAAELSWVVVHPTIITENSTVLSHDIGTLYDLTQLHALLARCSTSATEILTSLSGDGASEKNNLAVKTLATALSLDEQALTQALAQCSSYAYFYSWIHLRDALQWLDVASILGISPTNVATLVKLTPTSQYADWVTASHALQAGLNTQQTAQLSATLDEALSAAASAYVIKNNAPLWVTDRDKLYSWLLIDNQVSAQIKTTRIADAIASVQLYVNRVLSGQEEGVDHAVKSKAFFTSNWDVCNKHYSTWAGVSQLVYYPENYVDPTLRIGQTGMMEEMLQSLSQSQLTSDMVEDAFKTYMTRFEDIADLDVISGYHDSVSDQNGTTYIIGRSAIGHYYWRSANIDDMSDGKLPANSWTEWKKIATAISAVNNLVRPVIFQSRLYLIWVERRDISTPDGNTVVQSTEFLLNYAHIRHDGTWGAPVTLAPGTNVLPPEGGDINDMGMYCARDVSQEKLYIFFHQIANNYSKESIIISGINLFPDGEMDILAKDVIADIAYPAYSQLRNKSAEKLNTQYSNSVTFSRARQIDYTWGDDYYTILINSTVTGTDIAFSTDDSDVNLTFNAVARVVYNGCAGTQSRNLIDLVKTFGSINDTFLLPSTKKQKDKNYDADAIITTVDPAICISATDNLIVHPDNTIQGDLRYGRETRTFSFSKHIDDNLWTYPLTDVNGLNRVGIGYQDQYIYFSDFTKLNTRINSSGVKLFVSWGASETFTSDGYDKYTFDESLFTFSDTKVTIPITAFNQNTVDLFFTFSGTSASGRNLGSETFKITLTRMTASDMPVITLNKSTENAQYLQYGVHRIRVNTLFAKQLVARANAGLNTVLSMETQQLQEPKLGEGNYVKVTFSKYDKALHGDGWFKLYFLGTEATPDNSRSKHLYTSGNVSTISETTLSLFLPWEPTKGGDEKYSVYIGVQYSDADFTTTYTQMQSYTYDPATGTYKKNNNSTRGLTSTVVNSQSEPMDFNGANALYFWEMFYYVPMMVFNRLLSECRYTEATQWIKYIWSPAGYLVHGQPATYQWNVRPLEEDTAWHADPLDSVDPDAVAQADPLHYKVATFMSYLDLLIARGDAAYRQLERDTLNEAKMWYVQALDILGDEPYLSQDTDWARPRLSDAASKTTQVSMHETLMAVRQQAALGELRTANSQAGLFLPQQNEKLAGYWQTLELRLYNLRHNLSIDGSPLSLSVYSSSADPVVLLSAAVISSQGSGDLPAAVMPLYRFPVMLESARSMVNQLTQFGGTLLGITERQDAEALSELLQTQGTELVLQSIALQNSTISEIDADKAALEESLSGAQSRLDSYTTLYDEDVNTGETQAMNLFLSSSSRANGGQAFHTAAGALDLAPNIFGLADGGSRWGAAFTALARIADLDASATRTTADCISQSEIYRRRRQEWDIQRNTAQSEVTQINAQLDALAVRHESAVLQRTYLETQQAQTQAQMTFLQNKFTSKALYNWLRGKLAAIYYQFYDLTVSRCLMAQKAYLWALGTESVTFIRPGVWQGTYAGLMAGETLMLNLAQMEQSYLQKDQREKEVTRTVCLSEVYAGLSSDAFTLADQIVKLVTAGSGSRGTDGNGISVTSDKQLQATLKLSDLKIGDDYPNSLGNIRRIKQISVTLPALVGPYQDVRMVLSFGDQKGLAKGCDALAVSHGMNDNGQFQLDFNDGRWLPFEGIPVDSSGVLTLSFPQADGSQKDLLLSLTDIILHIRYTIIAS